MARPRLSDGRSHGDYNLPEEEGEELGMATSYSAGRQTMPRAVQLFRVYHVTVLETALRYHPDVFQHAAETAADDCMRHFLIRGRKSHSIFILNHLPKYIFFAPLKVNLFHIY